VRFQTRLETGITKLIPQARAKGEGIYGVKCRGRTPPSSIPGRRFDANARPGRNARSLIGPGMSIRWVFHQYPSGTVALSQPQFAPSLPRGPFNELANRCHGWSIKTKSLSGRKGTAQPFSRWNTTSTRFARRRRVGLVGCGGVFRDVRERREQEKRLSGWRLAEVEFAQGGGLKMENAMQERFARKHKLPADRRPQRADSSTASARSVWSPRPMPRY